MNKKAFAGLFLLIVLGAVGLRLTKLGFRPMHHDAANQARKFGALLESGDYRYDKADNHGPSSNGLIGKGLRAGGQHYPALFCTRDYADNAVPGIIGTALRPTCWSRATISGRSRSCWAMRMSRPP